MFSRIKVSGDVETPNLFSGVIQKSCTFREKMNSMNDSINKIEEGTQAALQFEKRGGLLPVVVQEQNSGQVLMVAYVNRQALNHTIQHREPAFWSTSRNQLWIKGETSGNKMTLHEILVDCDQDALIYKVTLEAGGICHTKNARGKHRKSCFYRSLNIRSETLTFK